MTPRARRAAIVAGVGVAVAAALALLRGSYALQALELKTLDLRFRTLADPARADSNIVVLDADNLSLELLRSTVGRWPWPRDVWAAVTRYASAGGARAIGFDFNFADPDLAHPGADEAFAEAAAAAGVVVQGLTLQQVHDSAEVSRLAAFRQDTAALRYLTDVLGRRVDGVPASRNVFQLVEHPYRALLEASRNVGSINYTPDPVDGTARRVPLVSQYRNATFLAFALATALTADSARMLGCGRPPAWTSEALRFCDVTIPLDDGAMLINWHGRYRDAARGRETYRIIPVAAVLKSFDEVRSGATPEVPLATFRGKVVLVGASGSGLFDARPNPFDPADPGVLIHATVVDNILNRDFLRRASPALNLAALFGGALLAAGIVAVLPTAAASVAAMLALLALEVAAGFGLFSRGLWLDTAAPSLAILVTFTGGMVVNYVTEGRQKKQIRDMFSKYVAPEYVAQLAEDPSALHLEGRRAELSILFSDIRGFTSISEKMQPAEVVGLLNDYLTAGGGHARQVHRRRGHGVLGRAGAACGPCAARV